MFHLNDLYVPIKRERDTLFANLTFLFATQLYRCESFCTRAIAQPTAGFRVIHKIRLLFKFNINRCNNQHCARCICF